MAICVEADTLDDIMRQALQLLLTTGAQSNVAPTRGPNVESLGARLQLNNPRARLSRTESRRRAPTAIAELAWYLSGSDRAKDIGYWISQYNSEAESDGRVHGAYGPRLFGEGLDAQFSRTIECLRVHPGTRRAVMQIFDRRDTHGDRKSDVPCTCTLQLLQRGEHLHMLASMRSNDAVLGLPHDVFAFTMLQEIAARELGIEPGVYIHQAASFHVYDAHRETVERFLAEGWQSTSAMLPMSPGSQTVAVGQFVAAESQVRSGVSYAELDLPADSYWADLVRLLA